MDQTNRTIAYYIVTEILITIVTLIYNFKLTIFNHGLNKWLTPPYSDSIVYRSLKMLEYQDGQFYLYLYGAGAIIFVICIITPSFWTFSLKYQLDHTLLLLIVGINALNGSLILLIVLTANTLVLWLVTAICVVGAYPLYVTGI
ncbi:hypothetical protein AB9M75_11905 [Lactobacillus sp. AN1001]